MGKNGGAGCGDVVSDSMRRAVGGEIVGKNGRKGGD